MARSRARAGRTASRTRRLSKARGTRWAIAKNGAEAELAGCWPVWGPTWFRSPRSLSGIFLTKDIKSLDDLFMHGLQDALLREKQIMKRWPT